MKPIIEISQAELADIKQKPQTEIVDIREHLEFEDFNIGGINVPAHLLNENLDRLETYQHLIVVCSNGTRSHILSRVMAKKLPMIQIYHLSEGIY